MRINIRYIISTLPALVELHARILSTTDPYFLEHSDALEPLPIFLHIKKLALSLLELLKTKRVITGHFLL